MAGRHHRAEGAGARPERSRRGLLAGAAGALGVLAAETVVTAQPAAATQGQPVILGQDNTAATSRTGIIATGQADGVFGQGAGTGTGVAGAGGAGGGDGVAGTGTGPGGRGVVGTSATAIGVLGEGGGNDPGVVGFGGAGEGYGVQGVGGGSFGGGVFGLGAARKGIGVTGAGGDAGTGVFGVGGLAGGDGVKGQAQSPAGAGVQAENRVGGTALRVAGPAEFSRSGVLTVAAGSSSGTKTGIALSAASLVLATIQGSVAGVAVQGVTLVTGFSGSFTIHLTKTVPAATTVAWFVVN